MRCKYDHVCFSARRVVFYDVLLGPTHLEHSRRFQAMRQDLHLSSYLCARKYNLPLEVKIFFRLATGFLVGIAIGAALFFFKPEEGSNHFTLERQQPSMGLVVRTITIPLIIAEVFLFASAFGSDKLRCDAEPEMEIHKLSKLWIVVLSDKLMFLGQQIFQAIIYIILRYKTSSPRYKENAQFYFKIMSFFNLVELVDSQVNDDSDVQLSGS